MLKRVRLFLRPKGKLSISRILLAIAGLYLVYIALGMAIYWVDFKKEFKEGWDQAKVRQSEF